MVIMLLQILQLLLTVLSWIIIADAIMSWLIGFNVISHYNEGVRTVRIALERITAPIYNPVRRIMPDTGPLDLSPIVVLLILYVLNNYVLRTAIEQLANASY
ncbi:YggT family protein [Sphingomonas soli]|uniref:YggT family protein n=1 Tax=Sphingomonas soli TaxID=266127 RepID=UPI0012EDC8EC|nr:YggT family protein [Sphingomonas soli]